LPGTGQFFPPAARLDQRPPFFVPPRQPPPSLPRFCRHQFFLSSGGAGCPRIYPPTSNIRQWISAPAILRGALYFHQPMVCVICFNLGLSPPSYSFPLFFFLFSRRALGVVFFASRGFFLLFPFPFWRGARTLRISTTSFSFFVFFAFFLSVFFSCKVGIGLLYTFRPRAFSFQSGGSFLRRSLFSHPPFLDVSPPMY